ncbi:MAG TPA: chemotaxis protein CheW [Bacillota bacterium]
MQAEQQQVATEDKYVVFQLGGEAYGVDINKVQDINPMTKITQVPRAPEFVEGIINLRGRVIPVIDLRKRFGLPPQDHTRSTVIVVVEVEGNTIGVIVDAVSEVLPIPRGVVEPPSPFIAGVDSDYLRGVAKLEDRLIILLDLEKALNRQEKNDLKDKRFFQPAAVEKVV